MVEKSVGSLVARAGFGLLAVTAVAGGAGLFSAIDLGQRLRQNQTSSEILRNHMEADMMHDALRADVLAALSASDPAMHLDLDQVRVDLSEHAAHFSDMVETNAALARDPEARAALAAVEPKLKAYIASANGIVDLASRDRAAAIVALPQFMADFSTLEDAMGATSEKLSAVADQGVQNGRLQSTIALWAALTAFAVSLAVVLALIVGARRHLVRPMAELTQVMNRLADGDTSIAASHSKREDEIGRMSRALATFRDNAETRRKLEEDQKQQDAKRLEQSQRIEALVRDFAAELSESLESLNISSSDLKQEAVQLEVIAQDAQDAARAAISSASGASENVRSIAAAATELGASIEEISSRMATSASAAQKASGGSKCADQTVHELSKSTESIGDIVAVISGVAEQTNLLALNATIEAARAGEAGRGFAVVASEVKMLANQTSRATEDISSRISQVQAISLRSVDEVRVVSELIEQMQEISAAVAAAAEQQSAATNSIASNVGFAAQMSNEAAQNVSSLVEATERTRSASQTVQSGAEAVEQLARVLRDASERFFERLKAA